MKKKKDTVTPVDKLPMDVGSLMGSSTGEEENMLVSGGWAGTDDATSTSISDQLGNPPIPEEEKPLSAIAHDFDTTIENAEEKQLEAMEDIADEEILHTNKARKKIKSFSHQKGGFN